MADMKPGDNPVIDYAAKAAQAQAQSTDTALAIHQQMDQQEDASNMAMVQTLALGRANATISSEQNALQAATDATNAKIRLQFGADPTQQGTLSNTWLQRMNDAAEKQYQSLDVIHEKQSKTLLNDPLGFISAQFTLPSDIATHNYYDNQRATAEEQLNEITQASNSNVIAATNAAAKTSTELAIAEGQKASANAQLGVAKLLNDAAGTRITGLNELNNLSQRDLSNVFQVHAAMNSDASLAQQRLIHEDNLALRKERLDKKSEDDASLDADRQAYNAAQKRMNKPTIEDNRLWRNIYTRSYGRDADFMNTLGQGQSIMANGGVTNGVAVADTAGETALLYSNGATQGNKLDQVGAFLADQAAKVKSVPGASKDRAVVAAEITKVATDAAKHQLQEINPTVGNIYSAPPAAVILKGNSAASDPFLDSVVKPIVAQDPKATLPDDVLIGKAIDFAKARGNLNLAADGVSTYYKLAVLNNNLTNQYSEKGLPKQTSYMVRVDGNLINAADPIAIKNAILLHNTRASISGDASFFNMMGQPGQSE